MDPLITWEEWSDLFELAVIAKEKIDIDSLLNPIERYHPQSPLLGNPPDGETETEKTSRLDRNIREQKIFDDKETASIKTDLKRFNGMRFEEADKTPINQLLSSRKRRIIDFLPKIHASKNPPSSLKQFWENPPEVFVRKTNVTFADINS